MKFAIPFAMAALLAAAPASADIIDLHIGQAEFDTEDFDQVSDNSGRIFRLSAVNFVEEAAYLRLELRRDNAEMTTPILGKVDATRQMLRFGLGERWGSTGFNLGFELGGAMIKAEDSFGLDEEETGLYGGLDLRGRYGSFEWRIDGTYYHKVPPVLDITAASYDYDNQTWYGGEILWYVDKTTAFGFRIEEAGEFRNASLFMSWTI